MIRTIRAARAFLGLVRDPTNLDLVFALADAAMDDATLDAMLANIRRHARGAAALVERPRLGCPPVEALAQLPPGTLGHAYAAHVRACGIDPAKLPRRDTADEAGYVLAHIYETHDLWHVVTGFPTDVAGELGLMAFYAAQGPSKGPIAILAAGMISTLRGGMSDKDRRMTAIARGWRMGQGAQPLFGVRWNELWAVRLSEVRRRFGIDVEDDHDEDHSNHQQPPAHLSLPAA